MVATAPKRNKVTDKTSSVGEEGGHWNQTLLFFVLFCFFGWGGGGYVDGGGGRTSYSAEEKSHSL